MADIANLIIRADFQNNATAGLTTLRKEVRSTATTVNSLNASLQNTKGILDRTSVSKLKASSESIKLSAAERRAAGGARALETGVRGSTASLGANAVAANTANIAVTRFGRNTRNTASNLRDIAVIGAVIGLSLGSGQRAIRAASAASVEFGEALTEVGTITGDSTASLNVLRIVANDFAGTFGSSSTEQVKAFYQAYSAGASNAAEASLLVSTANMLAVGGIATLESSVGLLASTLNAYSLEGLSAANASDLLFIAVRNGVTTISQLAQSLSRVTGTAANFGVAFGTVTAAIASLTGTGAPTAQATTQVNALILGLQRLTPEARAFATSLGISSTSPRDFVQVIRQLNGVLRGVDSQLERTSIIFRLFGTEVNALRAVASLTGGGFETFNQTLSDNERIVGATDVAYNKLHDTLSGRLMRSYGDLSAAQVKLGDELNRAIVPAVETFTDLVIVATNNIPVLGGVISALAAGALLALVRRMVALAITTTIATGGLNLLTAGTTALGAALIGTAAYGFLQFNSATNQAKTSLDELTTAQQTFTKAVMSGDQQLVASARQQLQILKNEADAEAERLREQIAAGSAIAGIDIREGTPVRSFTDFLGITSTNEDLTEAGFLLQRAEGRSRRLEAQLSAVVLNPDLLTDVEGLSTLFDNALQRGNELSTAYSTAFLGESPLQRLARENREYNESVDELIDNETRRISGAREQNQLDGGILTSEASLAADERRIAEADAIRNTTNDEFNEAYLRGLATRNEKELSARMALEERILAAALAGDRRREAQAEQERLDTIQATNDNISAGIGLASGDFNVDSVNTLLGNFATRLSEADGAVGMFGAELLSALPGIGQFLQIATAIPNIVGQRNFTGNEEFTANFQNGGFTDGNRTAETIYTGLIGAATRLQTGSRRGTEEIGLDSREFTGFQLGATRARVALRQYFDVVGEGTGVFDLAGESYEEVVAGIEDGLAGTVDGLSAVTREGESAASALARVANSFKDSNDALLEAGFGGLNNAILTGDAFSRVGGITNIADTLSLRTRQDRIRLAEDEYRRRLVGAAGNPFRNDQGTLIDPDGPTVDVRNNFERFNTREEFLGLIDTLTDAVRAAEQEIAPGVQTIREQFNRVRFDPTSFADATTQEQIDNRIEAFENRRDSQILALTSEALDPAILRLQSALEAQDEFELLFGSGRTALNLGSSGFATEADQRLAQAIRSDADPNQSVIDTIQKLIDANNGNFAGLTTAFEDGTSAAEFLNSQA